MTQLQCCGVEGLRDWQDSAWAGGENGAGGESGVVRAGSALDLSVSAPALYYWVPASCCACVRGRGITRSTVADGGRVRVRGGAEGARGRGGCGGGRGGRRRAALGGVRRAGRACAGGGGARAPLCARWAAAHAPLCAAAALLAAHVLALLLALALALRPKPHTAYKA
ncbi:unnamed protein product [Parnassius apollo]|uniref:(apollo) hypothetical protein n=1 Tax=Parnassius apollo TaxID=110799 RepID=A0A8S3X7N6_PARAO|nr:unnamed protein product [Parnassius apollo]